jgi:hypothetical protein
VLEDGSGALAAGMLFTNRLFGLFSCPEISAEGSTFRGFRGSGLHGPAKYTGEAEMPTINQ